MFTGIVEELGSVVAVEEYADAARLTVRGTLVTSDATPGASISVNGCCLTVVELPGDGTFTADVMRETLRRTAIGGLTPGDAVNLERATPAHGRLGGHIVQGHVDATGRVLERTPAEHWEVVRLSMPRESAGYVVEKGSVCVDGVSLTVVEAAADSFTVSLIPETLARTTLGRRRPGERDDTVNLEFDVIAKYVERLLWHRGLTPAPTVPAPTDPTPTDPTPTDPALTVTEHPESQP